jgi:hypothetical protein
MVTLVADDLHGGRWTSLRTGGREWLWHRPSEDRFSVRPGDAFVDVGGVEECIPTVRGAPDHGAAWSRPWVDGYVNCGDFQLWRRFIADSVAYRLEASPGYRFVWAAHALLDVSPSAVLEAPAGTQTRIDGGVVASWPTPLAALGPDDGTAVGAILVDCPSVTISDGSRLTFRLEAPGQPVSVGLWRNLRGWPVDSPYRSIGVEPMLGRVFDLSLAGPGDAAVVPASGVCEWRLWVS